MIPTLELGLIYGVVALGVYLTFRVLNFPDLTVDGSFTTGAAVAGSMIISGQNPVLATLAGCGAGFVAGLITGFLHTKGRIDGLLAGILTMIALWSVNLWIMGTSNIGLGMATTVFTPMRDAGLIGTWWSVLILLVGVLILKALLDLFLSTDLGLSIQASGNNRPMMGALGSNTDGSTILTLGISNGLVGLSGALLAQYQGFSDISIGVGLILVGLASVILGQAVLGSRTIMIASLAAVLGSVLYRLIIFYALQAGLDPIYTKLVTAVIVVIALLLPRWGFLARVPALRGRGLRGAAAPLPAAETAPADPAVPAAAGQKGA